jgi:hypothetical protein
VILTLVAIGLFSLPPGAEAPKLAPALPFTEVFAKDGRVVLVGKDFRVTAARVVVSPDGKSVDLRGTDTEPVTFVRTDGAKKITELSGKRIVYSLRDESFRVYVEGPGIITESAPKK